MAQVNYCVQAKEFDTTNIVSRLLQAIQQPHQNMSEMQYKNLIPHTLRMTELWGNTPVLWSPDHSFHTHSDQKSKIWKVYCLTHRTLRT